MEYFNFDLNNKKEKTEENNNNNNTADDKSKKPAQANINLPSTIWSLIISNLSLHDKVQLLAVCKQINSIMNAKEFDSLFWEKECNLLKLPKKIAEQTFKSHLFQEHNLGPCFVVLDGVCQYHFRQYEENLGYTEANLGQYTVIELLLKEPKPFWESFNLICDHKIDAETHAKALLNVRGANLGYNYPLIYEINLSKKQVVALKKNGFDEGSRKMFLDNVTYVYINALSTPDNKEKQIDFKKEYAKYRKIHTKPEEIPQAQNASSPRGCGIP